MTYYKVCIRNDTETAWTICPGYDAYRYAESGSVVYDMDDKEVAAENIDTSDGSVTIETPEVVISKGVVPR